MRQTMLLEAAGRCCGGGTGSLTGQVHVLLKDAFQQHAHSLVRACGAHAEQAGARLQDGLVELRREAVERERRINSTLEEILRSRREEEEHLERVHESVTSLSAGCRRAPGTKPLQSGLKELDMTPPEDVDKMKGSLVAIATELQWVHLQLSKTMAHAQAGVKKGRGDT